MPLHPSPAFSPETFLTCEEQRVDESCAGRVQRIDAVLKELETGDLKLRVRALEVERAARRSSILQVWQALLHTVQPRTLVCNLCIPCLQHAHHSGFSGALQL